jgi:hypothetical protein
MDDLITLLLRASTAAALESHYEPDRLEALRLERLARVLRTEARIRGLKVAGKSA